MTINYTSLLGLAQPVTGTETNTWGEVVNDEITALIEEAIAGGETIDVTASDVTLTDTDGVSNQARNAVLIITGTPGTPRNIVAPSQSKVYVVRNGSNDSVVVKGSATTGVSVPAGGTSVVFWNGSDFQTNESMTKVIVSAGTVSAPSITTTGDTNTGIFFPAADTIAFTEGGAEAMRIDASGNVGIGTSSPSELLEISKSQNGLTVLGVANVNTGTAAQTRVRLNNNTGSFGTISHTGGSFTTSGVFRQDGTYVFSNGAGGLTLVTGSQQPIYFATDSTERLRLDSSGNLGLGVTPASTWTSSAKVMQFNGFNSVFGYNNNVLRIANNAVFTSSNETYGASSIGATYYQQHNGAYQWYTAPSGTAGNAISWTQAMTLDASGNLGVGTTSMVGRLNVSSTGDAYRAYFEDTTNDNALGIYSSSAGMRFNSLNNARSAYKSLTLQSNAIIFEATNGSESARITSGGDLLVGTTTASNGTHTFTTGASSSRIAFNNTNATDPYGIIINFTAASPNGTGNDFIYCADNASGGTVRFAARSNGGLANYSANNVNLASDQRLKKDISPINTAWDKVKQIEVINFRYKDCNEGDPLLYGVIAQQVQPIVPELVVVTQEAKEATEDKEATPEYFGIREQPMYWLAIKALQEAMTRIETLEAQNAAFEARLAALEAK